MHILRTLEDAELHRAYETVFREAFPPEELKPLFAITRMRAQGQYDALGLFDGDRALGYICCWLDMPYILIDYLCVDKNIRSGGLGAEIIELVQTHYPPGTVFIGEVEAPTGDPEADKMILRRLGFYDRCGAKPAGYDCALFGVHYKTILWSRSPVDEGELMRRHEGFYRRNFSPDMYASAVQLPLRPGEKPFDRREWEERPENDGGGSALPQSAP